LRSRSILGAGLFFEKKVYFGAHALTGGKKVCMKKRRQRKEACKRKRNVVEKEESLTMIGLGFLIRIVTTIIM
jgi:hypothetical protein